MKSQKYVGWFFLGTVLAVTVFLRFVHLGYSDYIGDEHKAFVIVEGQNTLGEFFLSQRKGPMQFVVSTIPYFFTHDFRNELAQRIPFAIANVLAMVVFYKLVEKLTEDKMVGFLAAMFLSVCGFIVGFGRIAQYQSLNLLFSFLALWCYSQLLGNKPRILYVLGGTLFFSLSVLSHWDAIFILPPIIFIFLKFLKNPQIPAEFKKKVLISNFLLGCLILLPFLISYIWYQLHSVANMEYFSRRVEFGVLNSERYKQLIELYNPFVTFWFYVIGGVLGALFIKKSPMYIAWFLFAFGVFELLVRKPGTHIYNFIIPVIILCALGIVNLVKLLPKYAKVLPFVVVFLLICFLSYQSYLIFVDHTVEYPWAREKILGYETPKYTLEDKLPLFGFPLKRYWNEINTWVNEQNVKNGESFGYLTNEAKTISEFYMDSEYQAPPKTYAVGVKDPLSFVKDWGFTNVGNKEKVYTIYNDRGEKVVQIYRVE